MPDKPIYWIGTSKQDLAKFPQDAKRKTDGAAVSASGGSVQLLQLEIFESLINAIACL